MYKVTSRWPHQDSIKIEWNIGKRCNYDCSYCPSSIHDNTSPHTDIEILKSTIDKLMLLGKPIRLSFTGGEPCIHPQFSELIRYARQTGISWISVTTNGTQKFELYESLAIDQLVVSIHLEYRWSRIFNTFSRIAKLASTKVIAQIMAHHNYIQDAQKLCHQCTVEKIPYTVRRIRWTTGDQDSFDDSRYNHADLAWIKDMESTVEANCVIDDNVQFHANDIIKLHLNKYKDWVCSAGIESLMINWDGNVHRATCRVGGSIGNIYEDSFLTPREPVICDRTFCTCASDIPLTKYRK